MNGEDAIRVPTAAMTVPEFCVAHNISEAFFYKLRREGRGPAEMKGLGSMVRISQEAAAAWRRKLENPTGAELEKAEQARVERHTRARNAVGNRADKKQKRRARA
jgi:hypothetical protein